MVEKSNYPGVRFREHSSRKHGIKLDRYYFIRYRLNGKDKEEGVGWASEGITVQKAAKLLATIKENIKTGTNPQSLAEMRDQATEQKIVSLERKKNEEKNKITLGEFWDNVYLVEQKNNKRPQTIKSEIFLYCKWLQPSLGGLPLSTINYKEIEEICIRAKEQGKSPATIRYILAVFNQIWKLAEYNEIVTGDSPSKKIKKPKVDNARTRFLSYQEANTLLEALKIRSIDTYDAALFSLFAGLRAGEIHALTWGDINFDTETIYIKDPKNKHSRFAYISPEIKEILKRRFSKQVKSEYIITASNGKKRLWVSDTFDKVVNELGLNNGVTDSRQKLVFHSLRHTFASWLVQNGTPLYTVAELMGHKSLEMTQRYAHLAPDTMRLAALSLSGVLK